MSELTYRQAIIAALEDSLSEDPSVYLLGEDIGAAGGAFKNTEGLFNRFGPERVRDTPISEQAIVGCAIGSAIRGMRPVAEIMFADFAGVCFDQIANQLAKYRYMTSGQVSVSVTIRMANGAGVGFAAQHSQAVENWLLGISGLKIVAPGSAADVYRLLRASIADDDPVIFMEHKALFNDKEEVERGGAVGPLGGCKVVREGTDMTLVCNQKMTHEAQVAADELSEEEISVEVIDAPVLAPFDFETVFDSVDRTNRLGCVQETPAAGSWGSMLVAEVARQRFESLDAPPTLIGGPDTPIPYAAELERLWLPDASRIAQAVRQAVEY